MKKLFIALAFLLAACNLPGQQVTPDKAHCSALIMQALGSTEPVKGTYNCLAPALQAEVAPADRNDSLFAGPTQVVKSTYLGERDGGYAYRVEYKSGNASVYIFSVDAQGRVTDLHRAQQ